MAYKYSYDSKEEKHIETLTFDTIKKELLKKAISQALSTLIVSALVAFCIISGVMVLKKYGGDFDFLFDLITFFAVAIFLLISAISLTKSFYAIAANKIKVVTREVSNLSEHYYTFHLRIGFRGRGCDYFIHFKQYGKFLLYRDNYKWSEIFKYMSDKTIYDCTSVGDTFYLAILGDKKIGMVYNTKLFKYEGNITD